MITTSLAVIALAGGIGSGLIPSTPSWQTDYAQAMTRASGERKPMAVFIGNGADSFQKMLADGKIPTDAAKLLRDSYVCVYLDTATVAGKDLAGRFELAEGLIISSPGGSHQAYRHSGSVAGADITRQLTQYASAGQPSTTVTSGVVVGATYTVAPSTTYPTTTYPSYQYQYVRPATYGTPTYGPACVGPR